MSIADNKKVIFTSSINPELKRRFKVYCVTNNLYQNEVLENLIRELLDKQGKEGGDSGNTNK